MSKLEEQKALPRRKLFKLDKAASKQLQRLADDIDRQLMARPKRKAKKAKGKR